MGVWSMMLKRLERASLMVVWTGLSLVVVERAQADSLFPFCCWAVVVEVGARIWLVGCSDLPEFEGFRWSLGEPYFGEQHGRSNLACTTGEYCIFLRLREGDEMGVEPPLGVRQRWGLLVRVRRASVCNPTLKVWVVCVPCVVKPFVWHAMSRSCLSGGLDPDAEGDRMAFRAENAFSFMSSLKFRNSSSSNDEVYPTAVQIDGRSPVLSPGSKWLLSSHGQLPPNTSSAPPTTSPPFTLVTLENMYSCSGGPGADRSPRTGLWRTFTPYCSPPWAALSESFWQYSGPLMVLVVKVALVVRYQEAGWNASEVDSALRDSALSAQASITGEGITGPGMGQAARELVGRSQPLLLNSSMYLRSSGERGGVTSSRPCSPGLLLSGRKGELSIKRWKSLMEQTDFALQRQK